MDKLVRTLFSVLIVALALRAAYAIMLMGGAILFRLTGEELFPIEDQTAYVLRTVPVSFYAIWTTFVACYLAAAIVVQLRVLWALLLYATGFVMDFALTTRWFNEIYVDQSYGGAGVLVENALNAFDLSIIATLVFLLPLEARRKRVEASAEDPDQL